MKPPQREPEHATVDQHLKIRVPVKAGPHALGVAFLKKPSLLLETARRPYQARFNYYRHPRVQPAIYSISIIGPYGAADAGDTPSRAPDLRVAAVSCRAQERYRAATTDPGRADEAGVSPSGHRRRPRGAVRLVQERPRRRRLRRRASRLAVVGRPGEPALSLPRRAGSRRQCRRTRRIASAISSWRRDCRSFSGAAFRTTSC